MGLLGSIGNLLAGSRTVVAEPAAIRAAVTEIKGSVDQLAAHGRGTRGVIAGPGNTLGVALGLMDHTMAALGALKQVGSQPIGIAQARLGSHQVASADRELRNALHRIRDFSNRVEPVGNGRFDPSVVGPSLREASASLGAALQHLGG